MTFAVNAFRNFFGYGQPVQVTAPTVTPVPDTEWKGRHIHWDLDKSMKRVSDLVGPIVIALGVLLIGLGSPLVGIGISGFGAVIWLGKDMMTDAYDESVGGKVRECITPRNTEIPEVTCRFVGDKIEISEDWNHLSTIDGYFRGKSEVDHGIFIGKIDQKNKIFSIITFKPNFNKKTWSISCPNKTLSLEHRPVYYFPVTGPGGGWTFEHSQNR